MTNDTRTATGVARMASSARDDGKRQARPPADLRNGQHHGRIVSHAPGRTRVRLHPEHRDPATLKQIEDGLSGRAGVGSVSTDARTGSVLIHYDARALARDDLRAVLRDVGVVALGLVGADEAREELGGERGPRGVAPHSSGAVSVLDALTDLDHRISRLTGGKVDLKLMVPAGLGLLALRQIAANGLGLAQVPGYVLLWYTFDSFYKLHQRKTAEAFKDAAGDILGDDPKGAAGDE
jgi:hypothetical protein